MLNYFLYHRTTSPTGRILAKALGFRHWGIRPLRDRGVYDIVLRWGSSSEFPAKLELNPAEGIRRAANKWTTLTLLQEAGVSTVPFSRDYSEVRDHSVVYGRSAYGYGGKGIVLYDPATVGVGYQPGRHDFYTGGIDIHREYRLHVVGDEIVRVQGKYLDFPEQDKSSGRVCNHANGYRFKTPQKELHTRRGEDAIKAVKALGLDFGAVDLIVGVDGNHYVLEVNTGPSCSPMTADAYCVALAALISERTEGRWTPQVNTDFFRGLTAPDVQVEATVGR